MHSSSALDHDHSHAESVKTTRHLGPSSTDASCVRPNFANTHLMPFMAMMVAMAMAKAMSFR